MGEVEMLLIGMVEIVLMGGVDMVFTAGVEMVLMGRGPQNYFLLFRESA